MAIKNRYELNKDFIRGNLIKYTRKAFHTIPKFDKPSILDIGCGSGVPTIELARLSDGEIVAIDNDQNQLNQLKKKLNAENLAHRIKVLKCSMFDLDFRDKNFDIIWAEGSIAVLGFERGLKEWRRFLKSYGFLVVHDDMKNIKMKIKQISNCGYKLQKQFTLKEDIWWNEYYIHLEKEIQKIEEKHIQDSYALANLEKDKGEIELFKKNPRIFRSVFFIMQKE